MNLDKFLMIWKWITLIFGLALGIYLHILKISILAWLCLALSWVIGLILIDDIFYSKTEKENKE